MPSPNKPLRPKPAEKTCRSSEPITFMAILAENKQDRYGTWVVKLEVAQNQADRILELSKHTEKVLTISIAPPDKEVTFGRIAE